MESYDELLGIGIEEGVGHEGYLENIHIPSCVSQPGLGLTTRLRLSHAHVDVDYPSANHEDVKTHLANLIKLNLATNKFEQIL